MFEHDKMNRRTFLGGLVAGATATVLPATAQAALPMPPITVFSKHLQFLDYEELAKTCRELGLDGVDLTVRRGGHVLPENVATDLPRATDAIRSEGLEVNMITTRLASGDDPDARPILEAAGKLGIQYFRCGGHSYDPDGPPIMDQLDAMVPQLRALAELAEANGMYGGYHNHSGYDRVGAPMWDLHYLFEQVGSPHIGSNFDVGHATVEGAYGDWRITAKLLAPHVKMSAIKDFRWEGTEPDWVPLGRGLVPVRGFYEIFHAAGWQGPVSLHFEYNPGGRDELLEDIGRAVRRARIELKRAGYAEA